MEYKLQSLNVSADEKQLEVILSKVKDLGVRKRGLVNDEEFKQIVQTTIGKQLK